MPNFDGGHYFLTVLLPIPNDRLVPGTGSSAVHLVRKALATTPTACQSEPTEALGLNSPFARSTRTHFARFVVIDDLAYNGRDRRDALQIALRRIDPVVAQPSDTLPWPYLLFAADFDAASGEPEELAGYLGELWHTMEADLRAIFGYCAGFDRVDDAASFVRFIEAGQIETTMPFNDYWTTAPSLPKRALVKALALPLALLVADVGLCVWLARGWGLAWWLATGLGLALAIAILVVAKRSIVRHGAVAFPAAPDSDLPSILKALYLQQHFTQFAIAVQGKSDADLRLHFDAFVDRHRPADRTGPTQTPGVLRTI
jgi:hypothetical protein